MTDRPDPLDNILRSVWNAAGPDSEEPDEPTTDAAAKDTHDGSQPPAGASTLSSDVLDLLVAIRDALDVPSPELGTPDGYEQMRLLTHQRAASVRSAAAIAVQMGKPSWSVLAQSVRDGIERHPVTYPAWQDTDEPAGGEQS